MEVSGKEATDSYSKVVYESDRESLNESFTVHDGIGFSFGKGRTTADSAVRIFSLREEIGDAPLEGIEGRYVYRFFKRAFDICFSALVLVCFCWLYAAIAIWIKVDDPKGPVIFKQERVGKNGKRFYMHKFRSMVVDAEDRLADLQHLNEKTGPVFKIKKDPRVTRAGYWLRKLSLDELPQFWDVLKGNIPLRILKTRQGFSLKMLGAFALPARLARTRIAASLQVRAIISVIAGMPQIIFDNFIARYGEMREVFAKRASRIDFSHRDLRRAALCSGPSI